MRTLRAWLRRIMAVFGSARREREMADEIASHLQLHVDDNLRAGMTPEEARRQALIKFGPIEAIKEQHRERRGVPVLQHVGQDVRYALRWLRKTPAFSVAVIATIALAIGVNTAMFTVLNAAALQPLRTPQSANLISVALDIRGPSGRGVHGARSMLSWPEFSAVRDQVGDFDGAMAFNAFNPVTLGGTEPRQILATIASCEYFDVLRVRAELGRTFMRSDCDRGAPATVVITDAVWKSVFGADPSIVGRSVSINRTPFTVIGVTAAGFTGTEVVAEDVFVPIQTQPAITRGRNLIDNANMSWLSVIGRARDGASLGSVRAQLAVVAARLSAADPSRRTFRLDGTRATLSALPEARTLVLGVGAFIVGAVALVLLIACANIANLLLARSTERRKEFAIRMSLGASRRRLVQQLMSESLLLACIGGALGFWGAEWATRAIVRLLLGHLPHGVWPMIFDPRPDETVLIYAAALTTITGIAFGLVPALRGTRDATLELRTATSTDRPANRRLQQSLVGIQVAVCLVLLLSAGLLARGLYRAQTIDPGLDMNGVSVIAYDLRGAGYSPAAAAAFERRLTDRLAAMPGVRGVALTTAVPLSDQHQQTGFGVDPSGELRYLEFTQVSPAYFDLLGIPIVSGRKFSAADAASGRAAIVTESTAKRLWPGEDALTKTLTLDKIARPVVGVARDTQLSRLGESGASYVFLPRGTLAGSVSLSSAGVTMDEAFVLVAGTAAAPSVRELAAAVQSVDPELAVDVNRLADNLEQWRAPSMLIAILSAAIALLALVLALTGVFGTVAYAVSRRVKEIGIRVALGAARRDVMRLVVRQGMRPVFVGIAFGLAGSALASTLLVKLLYGLSPHDPWSFTLVPLAFFAVALAACYIPARRALEVEPTIALRAE